MNAINPTGSSPYLVIVATTGAMPFCSFVQPIGKSIAPTQKRIRG